jgi:hypothetical protein
MSRTALASLTIVISTVLLGSSPASASGLVWYRKDGIVLYHAEDSCYRWRGPRWDYAAAYYQSYGYRRAVRPAYRRGGIHRPKCGCPARAVHVGK